MVALGTSRTHLTKIGRVFGTIFFDIFKVKTLKCTRRTIQFIEIVSTILESIANIFFLDFRAIWTIKKFILSIPLARDFFQYNMNKRKKSEDEGNNASFSVNSKVSFFFFWKIFFLFIFLNVRVTSNQQGRACIL